MELFADRFDHYILPLSLSHTKWPSVFTLVYTIKDVHDKGWSRVMLQPTAALERS